MLTYTHHVEVRSSLLLGRDILDFVKKACTD